MVVGKACLDASGSAGHSGAAIPADKSTQPA